MIEFEDKICFGCGPDNDYGLKLKLDFDDDTKTAYGQFTAHDLLEGPPNIIHAGIIAALLDETMITVNKYMEIVGLTNN